MEATEQKTERNSESESLTNDDSSDNQVGPMNSNHSNLNLNTTTSHDLSSMNSPNLKSTGKNQSSQDPTNSMNGGTPKSSSINKYLSAAKQNTDKNNILLDRPSTPTNKDIASIKDMSTPSSNSKNKANTNSSFKKNNTANKKARNR